jgi:hypothetical protein
MQRCFSIFSQLLQLFPSNADSNLILSWLSFSE